MSEDVWLLWLEQDPEHGGDTEILVGVYRTEEAARAAMSSAGAATPHTVAGLPGNAHSEGSKSERSALDFTAMPRNLSVVKVRVDKKIEAKRDREEGTREENHALEVEDQKRFAAVSRQFSRYELKLRDDFLSHVSHELRSPLASIASFTSIIADGLAGETTPEQKQCLAIVTKNVEQLQAMIEDLLDVTQAQGGKLVLHQRPLDLQGPVRDAFFALQEMAQAKNIRVDYDVPSGLANAYADPHRVLQILNILLNNAIKFTPHGGRVKAQVRSFESNPVFLLVEVSDTGCGIDPQKAQSIFEIFYQVTAESQTARKGLGLGLHIAKDLVVRQGGEIWVKSTPAGSQFFFTLPMHIGQTPENQTVQET